MIDIRHIFFSMMNYVYIKCSLILETIKNCKHLLIFYVTMSVLEVLSTSEQRCTASTNPGYG